MFGAKLIAFLLLIVPLAHADFVGGNNTWNQPALPSVPNNISGAPDTVAPQIPQPSPLSPTWELPQALESLTSQWHLELQKWNESFINQSSFSIPDVEASQIQQLYKTLFSLLLELLQKLIESIKGCSPIPDSSNQHLLDPETAKLLISAIREFLNFTKP